VFLYTDNDQSQKEIKKTILFSIISKNKILQSYLTKEVKDLKLLNVSKEIKEGMNKRERYPMFMDWKMDTEGVNASQSGLQTQSSLYQNLLDSFLCVCLIALWK
jgi:hypothetical protein